MHFTNLVYSFLCCIEGLPFRIICYFLQVDGAWLQELRQDKTALAEELAATRKDKFVQQVRLRELQGSMKLLLRQNQDLRNGLQGKVELQPKQITQQDPQTSKVRWTIGCCDGVSSSIGFVLVAVVMVSSDPHYNAG